MVRPPFSISCHLTTFAEGRMPDSHYVFTLAKTGSCVFFLVMNTRVGQSDNAKDLVHTIVASFLDYILGGTTIASGFRDLDKWSH